MARIAAFKPKELQPAELLSTASYKPGEMIEYQPAGQKSVRMAEIVEVTAHGVQVKGQLRGAKELISFDQVTAVYERTTLERGPGEILLLTHKIKADGKIYENGSRQTIAAITAAWVPSVGTMASVAGRKELRDSQRLPASNQRSGKSLV